MTYKGKVIIGKPTLAMVAEIVAKKQMYCEAKAAYDYWENKSWMTKKGTMVKSLEVAIDVINGIIIERDTKKKLKSLHLKKLNKKAKNETKRFIRSELIANKRDPNRVSLINKEPEKTPKEVKKVKVIEPKQRYDEQLKDRRWYSFRRFVFDVRGAKCEKCGATTNLQVHHPKYKGGRKAWEYTCNDVVVLCRNCHCKVHGIVEN